MVVIGPSKRPQQRASNAALSQAKHDMVRDLAAFNTRRREVGEEKGRWKEVFARKLDEYAFWDRTVMQREVRALIRYPTTPTSRDGMVWRWLRELGSAISSNV